MYRRFTVVILLAFGLFGLISCDNGTGIQNDEPPQPEIPNVQQTQPDVDYFQTDQSTTSSLSSGFERAKLRVELAKSLFGGLQAWNSGLLEMAEQVDPELNESTWEWSYSHSYQSYNLDIRLIAEIDQTEEEANWSMYLTSDGFGSYNFDNYQLMEGNSDIDGQSGSWSINTWDPSSSSNEQLLTTDWNYVDEDEYLTSHNFFDPVTGDSTYTISYEKNGAIHQMEFRSQDTIDASIYWDEEQNIGYYDTISGRICWDATHSTVPCSDVGLEQ